MDWHLAPALEVLRDQINKLAPGRARGWDGSIGDARHAAEKSDHNPDANGIVHAIDVTHDPKMMCDAAVLTEKLRTSGDARIKYVIWNGRIFSSVVQPWRWRKYTGASKHDHHFHVSVTDAGANDRSPWKL